MRVYLRDLILGVLLIGSPLVLAQEPAAPPPTVSTEATTAASAATAVPQPSRTIPAHSLPRDLSPWGMFRAADWVVQLVIIGLALASVLTWTVWLAKTLELAAGNRQLKASLLAYGQVKNLAEAGAHAASRKEPAAELVRAALAEASLSADGTGEGLKERVVSRLERIEAGAVRRMNLGTGLLATIGSTAPFVGLFGTVWGIMNSFIGISKAQTTNLAVVAPGIAEALLATALGLLAAIPAVIIYNYFARAISAYRAVLADTSAEVLRLLSRDLDRHDLHKTTSVK